VHLVDSSNPARPAHMIDDLDQKVVPAAQVGYHARSTMLSAIMPAEMSR
jgi:D-aminopeptidase